MVAPHKRIVEWILSPSRNRAFVRNWRFQWVVDNNSQTMSKTQYQFICGALVQHIGQHQTHSADIICATDLYLEVCVAEMGQLRDPWEKQVCTSSIEQVFDGGS